MLKKDLPSLVDDQCPHALPLQRPGQTRETIVARGGGTYTSRRSCGALRLFLVVVMWYALAAFTDLTYHVQRTILVRSVQRSDVRPELAVVIIATSSEFRVNIKYRLQDLGVIWAYS